MIKMFLSGCLIITLFQTNNNSMVPTTVDMRQIPVLLDKAREDLGFLTGLRDKGKRRLASAFLMDLQASEWRQADLRLEYATLKQSIPPPDQPSKSRDDVRVQQLLSESVRHAGHVAGQRVSLETD